MPWWVQLDGRRLSMAMSADNAQVRYEQDIPRASSSISYSDAFSYPISCISSGTL